MGAENWAVLVSVVALVVSVATFAQQYALSNWEHRASNRLELQKILLDVNKLAVSHPGVLGIYDDRMDDGGDTSQWAYAFHLLNMFEIVLMYYMEAPADIKQSEVDAWTAWANYLVVVLIHAEKARKILEQDEERGEFVYSQKFRQYCKKILLEKRKDPPGNLRALEPWSLRPPEPGKPMRV